MAKPVYKRVDGEWIKQTAFEMVSGAWTQISTYETPQPPAAPVYGVSGLYQSNPTLTRTDDAVGMSFAINSSSGAITSDFNDVFPWNETTVETINGNKFVHFPDMWFRIGKDSSNRITGVAVSKTEGTTGNWYKVDSFYYSCYGGSLNGSVLASVSGATRLHTKTREQFRTYAAANGSGYFQLDLYHKTVLNFLWWIEWATKNSQSIMTGNAGSGSASATGGTDSLSTPSGYNTSGKQMRYHYIEDFVGNLYDWIDGIVSASSSGGIQYVTADPTLFSDSPTGLNATFNSPTTSGNCISAYGWDNNNPFLCMPKETINNSGYNTYFCTYISYSNAAVMCCGARWMGSGVEFGITSTMFLPSTFGSNTFGSRLIYKPV